MSYAVKDLLIKGAGSGCSRDILLAQFVFLVRGAFATLFTVLIRYYFVFNVDPVFTRDIILVSTYRTLEPKYLTVFFFSHKFVYKLFLIVQLRTFGILHYAAYHLQQKERSEHKKSP
jgi:hypothetical protein